jgi:hypothetical protein
MANGELCIHCGKQETEHELEPEKTCGSFVSEVTHEADCPIIGCYGDCAATLKQLEWEAICAHNRLSCAWFMDGPNLVLLDIGS